MTTVSAVIAVFMTSCVAYLDQTEILDQYNEITSLTAEIASCPPETKTAIVDESTLKMEWLSGDAISVFFGASEGSRFVTETSGTLAEFTGSIIGVVGGVEGTATKRNILGVYPYSSKTMCDGSSVIYTLPSVQPAKEGSMADDLYPSMSSSSNFYLSFFNICGGFRFVLDNSDIVKVTLRGNNEEELAGKAKISMQDGRPHVDEIIDGSTELVMYAPDGGCFEAGKNYYFALYPTEFAEGLTITFHKKDFQASYIVSRSYTLKRNVISYFDRRDKDLEFTESEVDVSLNNILFADAAMKEMCVNAFDSNGDSELSYSEAAAVTDLSKMTLTNKNIESFDEFQYFTGVKTIPDRYFAGTSIMSIVLPESLTSMGSYAFMNCTSLKSITIPELVRSTTIGVSTFMNCTSLTSVTIPESVIFIGDSAFENCTSLTTVTIPKSVAVILPSAFRDCISLRSVIIPESVNFIFSSAFENCISLTTVNIPDSVIRIEDSAFKNCTSLTGLTFPKSVTSIGKEVFYNCTSLTNVTIPESVTSIGDGAFMNCLILTNVTIPGSVTSIGDHAFSGCTSLTSVTIPESVTSIGKEVFYNCTSLTNVTIPESVTSIGNYAFYGCNLTSVTIPESVTSIGDGAFMNCPSLTCITIPKLVTSIEDYVFFGCSSLTIMTIPDLVTSIGGGAFENCTSLVSLTIPESVTSIGNSAFSGCTSLASIFVRCLVPPSLGSSVFYSNASDMKIYVPQASLDAYKEAEGWSSYSSSIVTAE